MKKLLQVTSLTGVLTLAKMLIGFVVIKVVSIYTGPSGLAMLGQLQNLITTLNGLVSAPVGSGVIRFTAENEGKSLSECAPLWSASLNVFFALFLVISPVVLFFSTDISTALFNISNYYWVINVIVLLLPLAAASTLINSVINGRKEFRKYIKYGFYSIFITASLNILLVVYFNVTGALIATSIQAGLIGVVYIYLSRNEVWFNRSFWFVRTTWDEKKAILSYVVMALSSVVIVPVSLLVIRNFIIEDYGWEAAGQWQAVWKISEVYLSVLTIALSTYFLPKLSSLSTACDKIREINNTAKIFIPIICTLSLCVYLSRDIVLEILFTADFQEASNLFLFQLIGDIFKITAWLYAYPMISNCKVKIFVFTNCLFSSTFIFLTYILMNELGVEGVVLAYMVNNFLSCVFVYFIFGKIIK